MSSAMASSTKAHWKERFTNSMYLSYQCKGNVILWEAYLKLHMQFYR